MTDAPAFPAGFVPDDAGPPPFPPGFTPDAPEAAPITAKDILGAASNVPVLGPMFHHQGAAALAALAPLAGGDRTLLPQKSFRERYEAARKDMIEAPIAEFQQQYPKTAFAAGLPGAIAEGLAIPGSGIVGLAAGGGAVSATDALMRGEDPVSAGLTGAAFGLAGPLVTRGVGAALPAAVKAAAPATQELKAAATAGYQHPIVKDVAFKPQAVSALADTIENDIVSKGFRPRHSAPGTFEEVRAMKPPAGVQSVAVDDLDAARKALGEYAKQRVEGMPTAEAKAASIAIGHIDDFLPNLKQPDLLRGDAQAASRILTDARGNYRAYKQAKIAETKMENARIQAASTYGGGNINNALRQAYRPLEVNNFAKASNWSPAAQAALKDVVEGQTFRNLMRDVGRSAPTGPVNLGIHGAMALHTGPLQLPIMAATYAAKKIGEAGTKKAATRLSEVIRSESPLARQQAPTTNLPALIGRKNLPALQALLRAQSLRGAAPLPFQQSTPLYFPTGP